MESIVERNNCTNLAYGYVVYQSLYHSFFLQSEASGGVTKGDAFRVCVGGGKIQTPMTFIG